MPTRDEDRKLFPRSYLNIIDQLVKDVRKLKLRRFETDNIDVLVDDVGGTVSDPGTGETETGQVVNNVTNITNLLTSHEYHMAYWKANGNTVFDIPDVWDAIIYITVNGLTENPFYYTLSSNGTQVIFDEAVTEGYDVTAVGEVRQVNAS